MIVRAALRLALAVTLPAPAFVEPVKAIVHGDTPGPAINRNIFGHFVEHTGSGFHFIKVSLWAKIRKCLKRGHSQRHSAPPLKHMDVPVIGGGGNVLAAHYANQFQFFSAILHTRTGDPARLIAFSAGTDCYDWTYTVMARAMNWCQWRRAGTGHDRSLSSSRSSVKCIAEQKATSLQG